MTIEPRDPSGRQGGELSGDEDLPHDAHLRAALRHAPDREARPPAVVRARILAAAHAAVRPATPQRGLAAWLAEGWRALTRPAAGAAFASLALATTIGLMWRDGPPPEALPGAERQTHPAAPRASAEAGAGEAASPVAPPVAAAPPPSPRVPPGPAPTPAPASPTPGAAAGGAVARAPVAQPDVARADRRAQDGEREREARREKAEPPPATAEAPAPAANDATERLAGSRPLEGRPAEDAPAGAAAEAPSQAEAVVVAPARIARSRAGAAESASLAAPVTQGVVDPLAAALAALADDDASRPLLAEARRLAAGRWRPVDAPNFGAATQELRTTDGARLGRFEVGTEALLWQPAEGPAWRAVLPAEALDRLRSRPAADPASR